MSIFERVHSRNKKTSHRKRENMNKLSNKGLVLENK